MVNSQYAFLPLAGRWQYWLALRHEWRHKGNSNRWNDQSEYDSRILLPIYRPVTGLWGFPITCPIHSFIKACKFYRKKKPKNYFSSCQHGVQSTMQGKRQAKRTRKSSSGKAEMKAGSIAWRKSKPWVAHLQVEAASQCVAWLPQKWIYSSSQSDVWQTGIWKPCRKHCGYAPNRLQYPDTKGHHILSHFVSSVLALEKDPRSNN